MAEKLADHVYGTVMDGYIPTLCNTCGASIAWGLTKNDKRAPFDNPRSEHGWVNHWVTCKRPPARRPRVGGRR